MTTFARPYRSGHWALSILGSVILLLGVMLLGLGGWLAALGGSWYYLVAGAGLAVAGALLFRARNAGAGIARWCSPARCCGPGGSPAATTGAGYRAWG